MYLYLALAKILKTHSTNALDVFQAISCTISWLAGSYSFLFQENDKFLTTKIVTAQNIFTFLLVNSILYIKIAPTFGFLELRSFAILIMNFVILIVFFENTLFINITSFLMFFLTSTVIIFNV